MAKAADSFTFDFGKYFQDYSMPSLDVESVLSSQRKNVETLTAANKVAYEGAQAVMQRQAELLRQMVEEATQATRQFVEAATPQDKAAKQAEFVKQTYQQGVTNARELGEMVTRCNTEAFDLLNSRFAQFMDEMRDVVLQASRR